jgi:hypothetical protein
MKIFTEAEMLGLIDSQNGQSVIRGWLERGDGCAVYRNMALDSASAGLRKFVSYGSKVAQLETLEPPTRLPDIGGQINWAYQLEGTCKRDS